jgi:hypothetical protein
MGSLWSLELFISVRSFQAAKLALPAKLARTAAQRVPTLLRVRGAPGKLEFRLGVAFGRQHTTAAPRLALADRRATKKTTGGGRQIVALCEIGVYAG